MTRKWFHWKVDMPICHLTDIWSRRAFWAYFLWETVWTLFLQCLVWIYTVYLCSISVNQLTDRIILTWMQYARLFMLSVVTKGWRNLLIQSNFYNYDLSSMLATKIHDLSSQTVTSKVICWQRQPFFVYLSSLMDSNNFIKSNCGFKFGRNIVEW